MVNNCTFCAAERSSQTFFLWSEMTNMICISPIWSRLVLSFNFDFSSLQVADWLRTRVEVQNWLRLLPFALLAHSHSARYFQQQQNVLIKNCLVVMAFTVTLLQAFRKMGCDDIFS